MEVQDDQVFMFALAVALVFVRNTEKLYTNRSLIRPVCVAMFLKMQGDTPLGRAVESEETKVRRKVGPK